MNASGDKPASAGALCAIVAGRPGAANSGLQMDPSTIPVGLLQGVVQACEPLGFDPRPALAAADLPTTWPADPRAGVAVGLAVPFLSRAILELGDESLGLHRRRLPPGSFELVTRASLGAANLGDALQRWCRYRRLLSDDLVLHLQTQGDTSCLWVEEARPLAAGTRDLALLTTLRQVHGLACWMIDAPIPVLEAGFPGAGPAYRDAYAGLFARPVHFGAHLASLRLPTSYLALPLHRDEAATRDMLGRAVELMLKPYERERTLMQRARQLMLQPALGPVTADTLARELNLSPRSLHRHLAQEGTSLQQIKDAVRRDQAIALLNRSSLPLKRIASQLSFSGEKSFIRAFRRWTGTTPTVWRQRARPPLPAVGASMPANSRSVMMS